VDKSLVLVEADVGGEARYRLLGTIRQYAGERLQEAGEAATVRDRHRDWFLNVAESAEAELRGQEPGPTLDRLEQEHDNLRAALEWSLENATGAEAALRLVGFLFLFWNQRGYLREGSRWVDSALAAGAGASPVARAMALHAGGGFAQSRGDYLRARSLLEEALTLRRSLPDPIRLARTLYMLGVTLLAQGGAENLNRSRALNEESLALARENRDDNLIANLLTNLGELARTQSDYTAAREFYQQALERRGKKSGSGAVSLLNLGLVAFAQNEYEDAGRFFEESLALCRSTRYRTGIALSLAGLAGVHTTHGDPERATRLLGAVEADWTRTGEVMQPIDQSDHDRFVAAARAGLDEASFNRAWTEGARLSLEEAMELALRAGDAPQATAGRDPKEGGTAADG
jgi:non-specific serine/threonine protein kinase